MATPPRDTARARLADAQQAARRAARVVEDRSRVRLNELLKLPSAERFSHIDDVDLTPADRGRLRRSIMPRLQPSYALWVRGWWVRHRRRGMRLVITSILHPAVVMSSLLIGAWYAIAKSHTPTLAYSGIQIPVRLYDRDGYYSVFIIHSNQWIAVERLSTDNALIRVWSPQSGYLHGIIPTAGLIVSP